MITLPLVVWSESAHGDKGDPTQVAINQHQTDMRLNNPPHVMRFCLDSKRHAELWALQDLNPRQLGPKPSTLSRLS